MSRAGRRGPARADCGGRLKSPSRMFGARLCSEFHPFELEILSEARQSIVGLDIFLIGWLQEAGRRTQDPYTSFDTTMSYPLAILAMILLIQNVHAAGDTNRHRKYLVEPLTSLTIEEYWILAKPERIEIGDLVILAHKYDVEYGFARRGLNYCAMVVLGSTDLGARPAGFRILTKGECKGLGLAKSREPDVEGFSVVFEPAGAVEVSISKDGVIRIDGKRYGRLLR